MQTWIFQGNPDEFDLDGYLASCPGQVYWLVTRHTLEIMTGDRVYIWRNQGKQRVVSGVIAEATVIEPPALRDEDPNAILYWKTTTPRADHPQMRAVMRLGKVAEANEVIRREWCMEDPILRDLPNLRMSQSTNYKLSQQLAERLATVWSRTGRDWTRDEMVAGLWAYAELSDRNVSRDDPNSPISRVALAIGRTVGDVYAKVEFWQEFFGSADGLRLSALREEFDRLWSIR